MKSSYVELGATWFVLIAEDYHQTISIRTQVDTATLQIMRLKKLGALFAAEARERRVRR